MRLSTFSWRQYIARRAVPYTWAVLWVSRQASIPSRGFTTHFRSLSSAPGDTLFSYSSGRFLYNERTRLRERYAKFNIPALEEAISRHVGRGRVQDLRKLSEGGFNRILLATMEDGFRAVVKIPYSISVPKTYAIASEVATLTFLRSKGIPVPEVYGCSSTTDNQVGVEYIIMEHVEGVGADTRWFENTKYRKHALVTDIVNIEKKLFEIRFGTDPKKYLIAIAQKEIKWTRDFGKPFEPDFPHNTVFPGTKSPDEYLALLQKYLPIAPFV